MKITIAKNNNEWRWLENKCIKFGKRNDHLPSVPYKKRLGGDLHDTALQSPMRFGWGI